ncbi:hypothetical protein Prum_099930 [Phytohabitans rumicis]|uniref:Uncharacterized protein n=1 Tax=Phytohabitans rumicis TaxID=1076125 RepID=A0A6V8LMX1_9ACTN|nr:hypothetical protein Prum_099930 [Phytohabitans rumicis]
MCPSALIRTQATLAAVAATANAVPATPIRTARRTQRRTQGRARRIFSMALTIAPPVNPAPPCVDQRLLRVDQGHTAVV